MSFVRPVLVFLFLVFLVGICWGTLQHELVRYDGPAKRPRGKVTDYRGEPIPGVDVAVYDNPQVWDEESQSSAEKRSKQKMIASAVTGQKGIFNVRGVPKGQYEVEFSRMGWNTLSLVLNIDPRSRAEDLCVELPISGGAGEYKVKSCH